MQKAQAEQALIAAARTDGQALKDAIARGTDFATAAAALKLKVTTLPEFVPARVKPTNPVITDIAEPVSGLEVGQVSEPIAGGRWLGLLCPFSTTAARATRPGLAAFTARFDDSQNDEQMRTLVYLEWTNWLDRQPGTHKPPDLEAFGGVE